MKSQKLVIVESPTKARTIKKFLGSDYIVESCMGHIRDLPESSKDVPKQYKKHSWSKLGVNVEKKFQPIYCVPSSKLKVVSQLRKKVTTAKEVILATDEDREGESISWHLQELLKSNKSKVSFKRMVFHEITKEAILESLKNFRKIDMNLVYAQEARRILDRLVGYIISPVLWKYVCRGLSAGRVQSVAVRFLSERELKRIHFKKSKYWSLTAHLSKNKKSFQSTLVSFQKKDLATGADFDRDTGEFVKTKKLLLNEKKAGSLAQDLSKVSYKVSDVKTQSVSKKPSPPFTTSTLQQEANRKLSLSAKQTMSLAQELYEKGFITYMRTDAVFLSKQAISACRKAIQTHFGKNYLPHTPRVYKNKSKGAQEAHEAIRPSGQKFIHPKDTGLQGSLFKLYQMIWQRTLASQTVDCQQKRVSIKISAGAQALFSASGMQIIQDGYYKIYEETRSNKEEKFLPDLKVGESLKFLKMDKKEHETQPPARLTEASLVQLLEKEGIGRPSTYASIISIIQKRGYVFKDKNMLIPTMMGLIVTKFLKSYFPNYVDGDFTSKMEQVLDDIAEGKEDHIKYLDQIYFGKNGLKYQVDHYEDKADIKESKSLNIKGLEGFTFFAGPYGAYMTQDSKNFSKNSQSLPQNFYPGDMTKDSLSKMFDQKSKSQESLGQDPITKQPIYILTGRYGPYVQRGEMKDQKNSKSKKSEELIKRVSIPKSLLEKEIGLDIALKLLKLPEVIGKHPDTSKEIKRGIGRFGPYIVHDGDFRSIKDIEVFFSLTQKKALDILSQPKKGRKINILKKLGSHPDTGEEINLFDGKYGPYIAYKNKKVSLPKKSSIKAFNLKQALEVLK